MRHLDQIAEDDLLPAYLEEIHGLKDYILNTAKPKMFNNRNLTGKVYLYLFYITLSILTTLMTYDESHLCDFVV